jgi:hypothetical protein
MANQPHPDKVAVNLRIWRSLRDRAKVHAADRGETLTDLIERLLVAELDPEPPSQDIS